MTDEQGITEAVGRTRHKMEWLRKELRESGLSTATWRLSGKPVPAWSDGSYVYPATGDPLPFLQEGDEAGMRVDSSYFGTVPAKEACGDLLSAMESFAAQATTP